MNNNLANFLLELSDLMARRNVAFSGGYFEKLGGEGVEIYDQEDSAFFLSSVDYSSLRRAADRFELSD